MSPSSTKENTRKHGDSGRSDRCCLVCADKSDGIHFGIYACRACTAFFRRTVVLNKKYVCRKGGNICKIDKSVGRKMCRNCRYSKCLALGMEKTMVHKKKDTEQNSASSSPNETTQNSENEDIHPVPWSSQANSSNGEYATEQPEALFKIMRNYRAYWEKQASTENVIKANFPQNVFKGEYPGLDRVTCRLSYRLGRAKRPHLFEFMATTFPEFMGLGKDDQEAVVHHFFLTMWVLDSAYRTYLHIPSSEYSRKSVHLQTSYIDIDHMTEFISDLENSQIESEYMTRSAGIHNYGERIGELMNLITTVLEGKCRLKLDMEMYNLLDAFKDDEDMTTANFHKMNVLRDSLPGAVEN